MKNNYIVCVCGDASRAAYLIKGEKNVLFDAGMAYSADKMIENIKRELGKCLRDAQTDCGAKPLGYEPYLRLWLNDISFT